MLALSTVVLPAPTLGLGAGVGFRYDEWRAVALGRIFEDRTQWAADSTQVGARVSRATLEVSVCRGFRSHRLELSPCAVVGLDHVTARGTGSDVLPRSRKALGLTLGGSGVVHLHLFQWVAVVGTVGLLAETSRPAFVVDGFGEVRRMGALEVSAALGSEWIF
jgi:hypothetical protein